MEVLKKILNGLCSIPVIGEYMAFVIGFAPGVPAFFLGLNEAPAAILCGLLIAGWCFFLDKSALLKIVTPVLPLPFWTLGLAISAFGVYRLVMGV